MNKNRLMLYIVVGCLGVSAVVSQLVLMRELLTVFSGNELAVGVMLGCWFLLMGGGAALAGKIPARVESARLLGLAQIATALLPVATLACIRVLPDLLFIRGAEQSIVATTVFCLLLFLPCCLVAGACLTIACQVLAKTGEGQSVSVGRIYYLDVIGDVVGGVVFTFVLVKWLDHMAILVLVGCLNLAAAILFSRSRRHVLNLTFAVIGLLALSWVGGFAKLDDSTISLQYPGQTVVHVSHSPYGRLVVTEMAGQFNFYEAGTTLFTSHDIVHAEESVHLVMAQRPKAARVLVIGGSVGGTIMQLQRYSDVFVDYVAIDPAVIEAARKFMPHEVNWDRVRIINDDPRRFLRSSDFNSYEVVLVDMPAPQNLLTNRYYTQEFFQEIAAVMDSNGVVGFQLGRLENHLGDELAEILATGYATINSVFDHVDLLPAANVHFLASNGELSKDVEAILRNVPSDLRYVNRDWIPALLTPKRFETVNSVAEMQADLNTDFSPDLYLQHLDRWLTLFGWQGETARNWGLAVLACLYLCVFGLLALKAPVESAVLSTGLVTAGLQVVLLLGMQVLSGSLYQMLGLVLSLFMAGLAAGAFLMERWRPQQVGRFLILATIGLSILAALTPKLLELARFCTGLDTGIVADSLIPVYAFIVAVAGGGVFALAARAGKGDASTTGARLYAADYVGACFGALSLASLVIPAFGLGTACLLLAAVNLLSVMRLIPLWRA